MKICRKVLDADKVKCSDLINIVTLDNVYLADKFMDYVYQRSKNDQ